MPLSNPFKKITFNKKTLLITLAVLLLLSSGALYAGFFRDSTQEISETEFSTLNLNNFASTVSATGTISTDKNVEVYTTQTAPVKEILVKENTNVEEGQILAYLDDKNLRAQIALKEAATGVSAEIASAQVNAAQNRYNDELRALRNGTNGALVSANNAAETAYTNWQLAENTYNNLKRSIDDRYNPELNSHDNQSDGLNQAVRNAQLVYDQTQNQVDRTQRDLQNAINDSTNYDNERKKLRDQINDLQIRLNQTQRDLAEEQSKSGIYSGLEQQLSAARAALDVAAANLQAAKNLTSPSPEAVQAAEMQYQAAQAQVDAIQRQLQGTNSGQTSALASQIDQLSKDLANKNAALAEAEANYSKATAERDSYEKALNSQKDAIASARLALENAIENLRRNTKNIDVTEKNLYDALITNRKNADAAQQAYYQALQSQAAAQVSAENNLNSLRDNLSVTSASGNQNAAYVELAKLYDDLQEMTIRAPISGVVTVVNAKVGSMPAGSIFKIENVNNLLIETSLEAFDVNTVRPGMKVEVKTDATGDQTFYGKVVSIAPVSTQSNAGASLEAAPAGQSGSGGSEQPTYKTIVALNETPNTLKAGMKARLSIILSEEKNVLSVPYSAVYTTDKGEKAVSVARLKEGSEDVYTFTEIPVKTGLENDLSIVVESDGLHEGDRILVSPNDVDRNSPCRIVATTDEVKA